MILGFTGTRKGLTLLQRCTLEDLVASLEVTEFHHGLCIGADAFAHELVRRLHPAAEIHGHACTLENQQAPLKVDVLHVPKPPLERNRDIVAASRMMLATPGTNEEQLRSGTWATVRYARRAEKPLFLILPTQGLVRING